MTEPTLVTRINNYSEQLYTGPVMLGTGLRAKVLRLVTILAVANPYTMQFTNEWMSNVFMLSPKAICATYGNC